MTEKCKTKSEKDYDKFEEARKRLGDTFILDAIISWWGYGDISQFVEENYEELGIEEEEDER
jgi:hypothetical protein